MVLSIRSLNTSLGSFNRHIIHPVPPVEHRQLGRRPRPARPFDRGPVLHGHLKVALTRWPGSNRHGRAEPCGRCRVRLPVVVQSSPLQRSESQGSQSHRKKGDSEVKGATKSRGLKSRGALKEGAGFRRDSCPLLGEAFVNRPGTGSRPHTPSTEGIPREGPAERVKNVGKRCKCRNNQG